MTFPAADIPPQFHLLETQHWRINHRMNSALPGYLMVGSKRHVDDLADLCPAALCELGPLLALVQRFLQARFGAERVYLCRFGQTPGFPVHFHAIPVYGWVEQAFAQDTRYHALDDFREADFGHAPDGADLTLYVAREFCERGPPAAIEGPSVETVMAITREELPDQALALGLRLLTP
ncbi:Diadenosine tetraphosphate (Ap4A) hydrolase [Rhizobium sp. RU35A]|uniref:HIT family protein n=1 Tax=Rhizobium sp. RU35A TaxID=1907414 RepID=UPI0009547106|nr:HIT domain-containing protein [Rhizobium sp. RU35A]SIR01198.1 Diadenosine tetraphosphate (Ap4A) hydrolase [Rhizobium sp. RU35A]